MTYPNGAVYEGDFVDGKQQGKGVMTYADGGVYTGDFRDGDLSGEGDMRYADGTHYVGEFRAGKRQGRGTQQGEFRAGVLYRGTLTSKAGRKFEIDLEQDTVFEILPDGTKRPVSQADLRDLIV